MFDEHSISKQKKHTYVGSTICGKCHAAESIGDQYDLWLQSPHAKATKILKSETAYAIAKKSSINEPSVESKCLKCHATGAGKNKKIFPDIWANEYRPESSGVKKYFTKIISELTRTIKQKLLIATGNR